MIEEGSKESFSLKRNYVNYRENYRQRSLKWFFPKIYILHFR
jgi:hypothetical protein